MGYPSKIDRLPPEIREAIGELRRHGRTIDEILAHLRSLLGEGAAPSRSALGAHIKQLDAVAAQMQRSRAIAEAMVERFGQADDDKVALLNINLLHGVVMKLVVAEDGGPVELDAKEAMMLAKAIRELASAKGSSVDVTIKLRRQIAEEAAKAADKAGKAAGLSPDTVAQIRREVLGIAS